MSTRNGPGRAPIGRPARRARTPEEVNALLGLLLACSAAVVLGCWYAAVVTTVPGVGWGYIDFLETVRALIRARPIAGIRSLDGEPPTPVVPLVVFALYLAAVVAVIVLCWRATSRWRRRGDGAGFADRRTLERDLGEKKAREDAAFTRPTLDAGQRRRTAVDELALDLGRDVRTGARALVGYGDHVAVLAPTGGGKTSRLMVRAAMTAPGALVVTANEVGLLDLIATSRAERGRVWVFDPLNRTHWPEPMTWDPVAGCADGRKALERAQAFAAGCGANGSDSTNAGFFKANAAIALKAMLHAAALGGRPMHDVLTWAVNLDTQARVASEIIRASDDERVERGWASALDSVSSGADETVASSRQTLQQAVDPLTLREVTRWVTPAPGVPVFDPAAFVTSTDTLVLISDDSSSTNVGPLCTMLFQEVVDAVKEYAPLSEHGKLDPPMRIVGDEFANVAPIDKAPEMSSEVRKLGVQMILAFQSLRQLKMRWGPDRGPALLENMAVELVLPGLKDVDGLGRYEALVGKVDVQSYTSTFSAGQPGSGGSVSEQERHALRADEIRRLPEGTALLVWRNASPAVIEMQPWYERDDAEQIQADAAATAQRRREHHMTDRLRKGNSVHKTAQQAGDAR